MKKSTKKIMKVILFIIIANQSFAQVTAQYFNLGFGAAVKVSNNGTYVCGNNYPQPGFLWSEATGRISLGNTYTEAMGVSNNGIVAGSFIDSTLLSPNGNPTMRAGYFDGFRWVALEGFPGYPVLDEMTYNYGYGISADGSMIVGMHWLPIWKTEACYWDSNGAIHMLGRTGSSSSCAYDVAKTPNGFVIAGWDGQASGPDRRPFYWDLQPHFMGGYDSTYPVGQCNGLNSDGSKIVGGSAGALFEWTMGQGMNWFNTTYLNSGSYAKDISDNGIIVGHVDVGGFNYQGFIKKPEWQNIILIKNYLIDSLGITEASNWINSFTHSISADGLTISGTAYPTTGGPIAYVVKFSNPLPVELNSFKGSCISNTVTLSWVTSSETNNQGFDVERKTKTSEWQKVGFVTGSGTSTEIHSYNFTDQHPLTGTLYYRLKQIDFNGSFEYSNIIEVNNTMIPEFSLNQNYPNPFNPTTMISFTLPITANVKLSVFNMLGEKVAEIINETKNSGHYDVNFDGSELTSGVYLYQLEAGNSIFTKKMILMR